MELEDSLIYFWWAEFGICDLQRDPELAILMARFGICDEIKVEFAQKLRQDSIFFCFLLLETNGVNFSGPSPSRLTEFVNVPQV